VGVKRERRRERGCALDPKQQTDAARH